MAKQKSTKSTAAAPAKVRVSHTVDSTIYRRFRVAAAQADKSESEMFEWLINHVLSGVHARGMPNEFNNGAPSVGQGSGSPPPPPPGPSGPSYAAPQVVTEPEEEEELPVTASNLVASLPEPTPGAGFDKRTKFITGSYRKATAHQDQAIDDIAGR